MDDLCSSDGCTAPARVKGLCKRHYGAAYYAANRAVVAEKQRAYYDAHKADILTRVSAWQALHPGQVAEYKRKSRVTCERSATASPGATRARNRRYRARHPERVRAAKARWKTENPAAVVSHTEKRRQRKAGVDPIGLEFAMDSGMTDLPCSNPECRAPGPSHIDHIIPLSWAEGCPEVAAVLGKSWAYQPLCARCNGAKGAWRVECYVPTGDIGAEPPPAT